VNQLFIKVICFGKGDTMGERMGRIGQIRTDFFDLFTDSKDTHPKKKSVRIRPIRPIRSPIVSLFSKAEITGKNAFPKTFEMANMQN
jgi:hypothetical protein